MGKYATREDEVDRMLRAGLLVTLHTPFSNKPFVPVSRVLPERWKFLFIRHERSPYRIARAHAYVEHRLESMRMGPTYRVRTHGGLQEDDCRSTDR